jgi:pimeloyl-ACP methyl ester carboxylesterase
MNGEDGTTSGWSPTALRGAVDELAAFARMVAAFPWRSSACDALDDAGTHPVPVVFVHGLLGDTTNFFVLRRRLSRHGIRCVSSFAYRPRLDYQHLATQLAEHIGRVCDATGARQVDVVGHSLGGLVARYYLQTGGASRVRRLVTLGTPYFAGVNPPQELSIFAEHDALVPPPPDAAGRAIRVVSRCGHLGLLTHPRAVAAVAHHLRRPRLVRVRRSQRRTPSATAA